MNRFVPATGLAEAQRFAERIGVDAAYPERLDLANFINEALVFLRDKGADLPPRVEINRERFRDLGVIDQLAEMDLDGTLYVDPTPSFWDDPAGETAALFEAGYTATGERFHVVAHELGHWAHLCVAPDSALDSLWADSAAQATALKVSGKAAEYPGEFVAEVFAGLLFGNAYGDDILSLYNVLGGPKIGNGPQ